MYPTLLDFGFIKIGTYGFIALVTMGITLFFLRPYARREHLPYSLMVDFYFVTGISGFFGAKLVHIMISYKEVLNHPKLAWLIFISGGVWYGGLFVAFVVGVFYARYKALSVLKMMDTFAPLTMLGLGIARFGCFFSGCCYGRPTHVPWAVTFTNVEAHLIHPGLPYVPIHPTQLYEAFGCFVIALILHFIYKKKRFDGQAGLSLFILYGFYRSYIEIYRGDFRGSVFGGFLSTSQFLGLSSAFIAIVVYLYLWSKKR